MLRKKRILLVGAHPDDIAFMCGGTMSKYQGEMAKVKSIIFTPCLEDPYNEGKYEVSMKTLGIKETISHDYPRDILENHIQDVRNILRRLKAAFDPEVVFCHSTNDLHQDHRVVARACQAVFRDSAIILSGEVMRSTVHFAPNLFISLSYENMVSKLRLLNVYKNQLWKVGTSPPELKPKSKSLRAPTEDRAYLTLETVESVAKFRGYQVSTYYAEAFEMWGMIDR